MYVARSMAVFPMRPDAVEDRNIPTGHFPGSEGFQLFDESLLRCFWLLVGQYRLEFVDFDVERVTCPF